MFESGAILVYLAEKTGKLLAPSGAERYAALEWLNWQMGGVGPMFGQLGFFAIRSEEKSALAIKRFTDECERLLDVMDRRLAVSPYLAGPNYTIADIAGYPWVLRGHDLSRARARRGAAGRARRSAAGSTAVGAREAVQRGMAAPKV